MLDAKYPVVFFARHIGDHILVLPTLRALANLFQGRLGLICHPWACRMFFSDLPLCTVFEVDVTLIGGGVVFDAQAVTERLGTCDLFISLHRWHTSSINHLLKLLAPANSIGFSQEFKTRLPHRVDRHSADVMFGIPRRLDPALRLHDFAQPPRLPEQGVHLAKAMCKLVHPTKSILVVHADTKPEKMWSAESFVCVLDLFLVRHPDFVAFVVGVKDLELDGGRMGDRVIPLYGLTLEASLALVSMADLFLGVDSCMLHIADICRVPGVGLFGMTSPEVWGFRFARHRHLDGHGSLEDIEVADVLNALESLL